MVLIQRAEELALMDSALDGAAAGKSMLVLVEGAVGCGKSEFLQAVALRAADRAAVVLRATGTATERDRPLGVVAQLVGSAPAGTLPAPAPPERAGCVEAQQAFTRAVHELSDTAPVVIAVDDLHHVDELSRRHLLHLARETRSTRVLLVLAASVHEPVDDPLFATELLRQPNFVRVRLERLDRAAVATLLAGRDTAEAERLHRASGGNPLLLRALLQDPGTQPGGPYTYAVLACLHRCGAATTELARAVAVLDGHGGPELVARLLDIDAVAAARGMAALGDAGLLDGPGFRHPAARDAVLGHMDPADRRALHRRAAVVAHGMGAPAPVVAAQLLGARHTGEEWAMGVLRAAVGQFLADGDAARAAACLELAQEGCADDSHRAHVRIRLAAVTARTDPAAAEHHLSGPLTALREGRLPADALGPLARALTAQGRIDEAVEALDRLTASGVPGGRAEAGTGAGLRDVPGGLRDVPGGLRDVPREDPLDGLSAFPHWAAARQADGRPDGGGAGASGAATRGGLGPAAGSTGFVARGGTGQPAGFPARFGIHPAALWAVPEQVEAGAAAHVAEVFLRGASPAEGMVEPLAQALRVLLYLGGPARALPWCEMLAAQSARRGATGWQAVFGGLLAEARLGRGDLAGAGAAATAALDAVPGRGGSVLLSGIAGTLVRAYTAMGRTEAAAAVLGRPVPEELAGSVHGLAYLRARGQYALATSRYRAALGDFLDIGRRMKRWGLDRPQVLPWRTDAASALMRLGELQQAERFITDQLSRPDAADPRVRGVALRLQAELREPKERQTLLTKAVDELRRSGDQYELALTLVDLGRVLKETGEPARAAMANRRAWHLARDCGAEVLCEKALPGHTDGADPQAESSRGRLAELVATLSESEKRVAMLAVHGHTNREIALKLYITVSTVEQHLTRVYRKLDIAGRQELPVDLQVPADEYV
ncbi:helix-turn-helix transcriptional regulator [Streptomyces spiralis]|uniref:helix-turn-helix transcriptional regulator n=1 Tax=Streptomyces spiralis TaxID=66376 RepID=UPI0033E8AE92